MLEVGNVALPLDAGLPGAPSRALERRAVARALGLPEAALAETLLLKRSIDARRKAEVRFCATFAVSLADRSAEEAVLAAAQAPSGGRAADRRAGRKGRGGAGPRLAPGVRVKRYEAPPPLSVPDLSRVAASAAAAGRPRPLVVGMGPAGLFAALYLAEAGLRPLVLERGGDVDERLAAVAAFDAGGPLDVRTNIQFGEGGAGTFSDGKLTTGTKSPHIRHVLEAFVSAGAPREILWQAKPHIGTDRLVEVVRALRQRIVAAGGEVRFHARLAGLHFQDGILAAVDVQEEGPADADAGSAGGAAGGEPAKRIRRIPVRRAVLACGHSARDTFEAVRASGAQMERKPFSVGVRIEHPQSFIDRAQHGRAAGHPALGAADYKLAVHLPDGRGVYTFCMCPGGQVVAAASEEGGVVVNGMSRFARDGANANSALLAEVRPGDLEGEDVLAGVELQRRMERAAYRTAIEAGGAPYAAPAQTVGDFLAAAGEEGAPSGGRAEAGGASALGERVSPSYPRGVAWCDLRECLPPFAAGALAEALPLLDRKLHGFADAHAVMTGVETRSSSPVRIVRDEGFQALMGARCAGGSPNAEDPAPRSDSGLYPCGEGAGYAGGIMSAAVDGLRVAEALAADLARDGGVC